MYIVHGTNDEVISYSHAEDLVRNCQEGIAYPPYMVENGGHNNLEVVGPVRSGCFFAGPQVAYDVIGHG